LGKNGATNNHINMYAGFNVTDQRSGSRIVGIFDSRAAEAISRAVREPKDTHPIRTPNASKGETKSPQPALGALGDAERTEARA